MVVQLSVHPAKERVGVSSRALVVIVAQMLMQRLLGAVLHGDERNHQSSPVIRPAIRALSQGFPSL